MQDKKRARIGRPRGEISNAVLAHIARCGPVTAREIATQLQITLTLTRIVCSRLQSAGEIEVDSQIAQHGARRPVNRYRAVTHIERRAASRGACLWGGAL